MIVVDTNVISEAMNPAPNQAVIAWLNLQSAQTLFITSVSVAELVFGIGILPAGNRKNALADAFEGLLALFEDRVLPFDVNAARHYALIASSSRANGQTIAIADGFIAGIAGANGFAVATRDTAPFKAAGLAVINPWQS